MEFLKIENLCKVYGKDENQVTALDHVSLTIEKGEFVAVIGSSGSGKSTLLHIIGGVDLPTSGKVYLAGRICGKQRYPCHLPQASGRTDLPVPQPHPHPECGGKYHPSHINGQTGSQ